MSKGLEVWNAVKKYLNLYHHQAVKENIDVETVEGMPIDIIEKELKAIDIIRNKPYSSAEYIETITEETDLSYEQYEWDVKTNLNENEYYLLKEVLK